jgi:hypothetical protein
MDQTLLIARADPERTWTAPALPSLEPPTTFEALAPPHTRPFEPDPVKLENGGLTSQHKQSEFWDSALLWKAGIAAKLRSVGSHDIAQALESCHTSQGFAECNGCKRVRTFWNRCDRFFCPCCTPRLARERRKSIEWWTAEINQPKHLVLTTRNTDHLSQAKVKGIIRALQKLRRRSVARSWRGGCWSLEITNEGRGWHLHLHLLIDAPWVDIEGVSRQWGTLVGQDYAIVKVKDCRQRDYLAEVTKYAVKGSTIAAWTGEQITHFVNAFTGVRTFGVFGSLYGKRTQWREWIKSVTQDRQACECGCKQWTIFDADGWRIHRHFQSIMQGEHATRPPPQRATDSVQPELSLQTSSQTAHLAALAR